MDNLIPPPDGDQDRGPILITICWTMFAIGSSFTSLRFYARYKIHAIGMDDWVMLLTTMLFLAVTIAATLLALQGGGPHLYFLVLNHRYPTVTRLMHIAFPLSYMPLATGRISVAILILRIITRSKWRRRFLYLSIITTFVVNVVWCILWFVGCPPGTSLSGPYVAGHCWNASVMFGYSGFTASWNVFMDFVLALLPVTIFWKLQLSRKKRLSLCVFTAWGLLAAASGAIKTAKINEINAVDFTWAGFDLYVWSTIETFLIITCGCIPTLKPLYDTFKVKFSRPPSRSKIKAWYSSSSPHINYHRSSTPHPRQRRGDTRGDIVDNHYLPPKPKPLVPVHAHRPPVKIAYRMEVGLWSGGGGGGGDSTAIDDSSTAVDDRNEEEYERGRSFFQALQQ